MRTTLLRRDWPAAVAGLLRVQLREPREETEERSAIAALTLIRNDTSVEVMRQYEENPYPRWTVNPLTAFAADLARGRTVATAEQQAERDILIAGCGTGSHAIQIAQVYPNARLLAVDISMTSLAYARRKTRELGLRNIDYAQADILELGTIDRSFDSIESVGVLHHLAEPLAGWKVLVSLLRPGGTMRIGLYSELARRVIVEARSRIAARNYRATADDIRRCRQEIFREAEQWKPLIGAKDFYSTSGCHDLLFNVMEHRLTISEIAAFLNEHGLTFQGFEPFDDPTVLEKFREQFPGTADETNLDQWQLASRSSIPRHSGTCTCSRYVRTHEACDARDDAEARLNLSASAEIRPRSWPSQTMAPSNSHSCSAAFKTCRARPPGLAHGRCPRRRTPA